MGDLGRDDGGAQERAVDVQITRLRRKIEADPKQPRYLQTVRGEGYMLRRIDGARVVLAPADKHAVRKL